MVFFIRIANINNSIRFVKLFCRYLLNKTDLAPKLFWQSNYSKDSKYQHVMTLDKEPSCNIMILLTYLPYSFCIIEIMTYYEKTMQNKKELYFP